VAGGEAEAIRFEFQEALGAKRFNCIADGGVAGGGSVPCCAIGAFDAGQIDAFELPEAEEKFFFEGLLGGDLLDLFARRAALLDCGDVFCGIVNIGPTRFAIE